MEPFIAQIMMFGGNFAPRGWALCDGQLLPISQYSALFSLLGTIYGGDGETTFGLPDLRGRVPMHAGNGPGLSNRRLGSRAGSQTTTLNTNHLPSHNHTAGLQGTGATGDQKVPEGGYLAAANDGENNFSSAVGDGGLKNMAGGVVVGNTGSSQAFSNEQPYTVVNFIIALQGIYPSRN